MDLTQAKRVIVELVTHKMDPCRIAENRPIRADWVRRGRGATRAVVVHMCSLRAGIKFALVKPGIRWPILGEHPGEYIIGCGKVGGCFHSTAIVM